MRISHCKIEQLVQALSIFIQNSHAQLRLYGSRVDDTLKGGDIDLLLLIEDANVAQELTKKKHYLLANIKGRLGDQKIDLIITDNTAAKTDAFLQMILPKSVCLYQWRA